jgi:predicted Zn-dependent protease
LVAATDDGDLVNVSGYVTLDAPALATAAMPDRKIVQATIQHELGHLVGLDHTDDRRQLMFAEGQATVTDYADGDRRGLALLGTQPCHPEL